MSSRSVRTRFGTIWLCLLAASLPSTRAVAQVATYPDSAESLRVARRWLTLLDSGRYAASLDSAAPLLRQMTGSADAWRQLVIKARAAFPANPTRDQAGFDPAPDVTGAPPGRYFRITFRIAAKDATVYEVVVLQQTTDGWRVAMYGTHP